MTAAPATTTTAASSRRATLAALWAGLLLSVLATAHALADSSTTRVLAEHIRSTYPTYGTAEVDAAVLAWVTVLGVVGGLGVVSWSVTIWATVSGRSWVPWVATGLLLVAVFLALAGLTVPDTSGEVGLAPLMGWIQVLPCVAGLAAVALLWRRRV